MTQIADSRFPVSGSKLASSLTKRDFETQDEVDIMAKRIAVLEHAPQEQIDKIRTTQRAAMMSSLEKRPTHELTLQDRVQFKSLHQNEEGIKSSGTSHIQSKFDYSDLSLARLGRRTGLVDQAIELEAAALVGGDRNLAARMAEDQQRKASLAKRTSAR
jgi:hypothetical protein